MSRVPPLPRPAVVVTVLWASVLGLGLYAALSAPLNPDLTTVRGPDGRLIVAAVAFNGPAQTDGVVLGDVVVGHRGQGAGTVWLLRTPGGTPLDLAAPPLTSLTVLGVALGWGLLLLGLLVVVHSRDRPAAGAFWRLMLLLAGVLGLYPTAEHGLPGVLALHFALLRLCGPALLELALVVPVGPHPLDGRPLRRMALWLPALALLPFYPMIVVGDHAGLRLVPELVLLAYIGAAAVALLWRWRQAPTPRQQAPFPYLVVGLLGGLAPSLVLTLAPQLLWGRPLVPADGTLLALGLLPLCVGVAIARVELFGLVRHRRTRWLLTRLAALGSVTAVAGLSTAVGQEPWRLVLPFAEAGGVVVIALLYEARRPRGRMRPVGAPPPAPDSASVAREPHQTLSPAPLALPQTPLSPREREVLGYAAHGLHNGEIAARLHVGTRTVSTHLSRTYAKLAVHGRVEAIKVALEQGLLPPDEVSGSCGETPPATS